MAMTLRDPYWETGYDPSFKSVKLYVQGYNPYQKCCEHCSANPLTNPFATGACACIQVIKAIPPQ